MECEHHFALIEPTREECVGCGYSRWIGIPGYPLHHVFTKDEVRALAKRFRW